MNYVNLHVTCEKNRENNFFEEVKLGTVHLLPQINYTYHYATYKFVFFLCIQYFCTWFSHRPIVATVGRAPAGRSRPPAP
jgi:hypothetical protein